MHIYLIFDVNINFQMNFSLMAKSNWSTVNLVFFSCLQLIEWTNRAMRESLRIAKAYCLAEFLSCIELWIKRISVCV